MKVIELFNKIANEEDLPIIKHNDFYGKYNYYRKCYEYFEDKNFTKYHSCSFSLGFDNLNDEVEVIEENKKIKKIGHLYEYPDADTYECWNTREEILVKKINEIIDKVNSMEGK